MVIPEKPKTTKNNQTIWIAGIILAIATIIIIFLISSSNKITTQELSIGDSPVLGSENAPVIIYEFSDFSCPFCQAVEGANPSIENALKSSSPEWEAPMPLIKDNYVKTGKVKIVFKYFPGHGEAEAAHAVAFGLNKQNPELFWKFAEKAYADQNNLNNVGKMIEIAISLGADPKNLTDYIDSGKYTSQIKADISMGKSKNIKGTPTFFINEKLLDSWDYDSLKAAIERELR